MGSRESVGKFARVPKRPPELMRNFVGGVDKKKTEKWGVGRVGWKRAGGSDGRGGRRCCRLCRTKVKERTEAPRNVGVR